MDRNVLGALLRVLPDLLCVLAALCAWRGVGLLVRFGRDRAHRDAAFWLVRGGRGLILAAGALCVAAGLAYSARGLLLFGLGFLGEEIYETGMVLLILRWDRRRALRRAAA